ncbi:MAG: hypothetical protein ABIG44_16610 [Planctomycetota bacterium]
MAFIKTHLISLICGVVVLASIVVAVLGMMSTGVVEAMQQKASIQSKITSLRSSAKNDACIQAEAQRGQEFEEQYSKTVKVAEEINARPPLMSGVFPKIERDAVAFNFGDAYREAVQQLPRGKLEGGDLPSEADIQDAQDDVTELLDRKAQEDEEGKTLPAVSERGGRQPAPARVATGPTRVAGPGGRGRGMSVAGVGSGEVQVAGASSVNRGASDGDPKYDPIARANITKARNIRCYASTNVMHPSFHISPIWSPGQRLTEQEMWYAQVSLWVQQDLVAAITEVNEEAAKSLKPEDVHVENMPVKRIQAIRVLGYWTGTQPPVEFMVDSASQTAIPGGTEMKPSFTGRKCDQQFDVIRFKVVLVVDQRDLQKVIDVITKKNFYKCIGASCDAITLEDQDYKEGYLYGPAPVERAILDFEGYMAREIYEKMYPAEVREALGINQGNPQP